MTTTGSALRSQPGNGRPGADTPRRAGRPGRPERRRFTARAAIAALGTPMFLLAFTGCGSSTSTALPVATVVSKVNAICSTYSAQMEVLAAPSFTPASVTAAELGTAAKYLNKAVPLLQQEQASIEAVGRPKTDGSVYDGVLTALAAQLHDESAAQTAAQNKNLDAFHAAVLADQNDGTRLAGVSQQFGLNGCVGGGG